MVLRPTTVNQEVPFRRLRFNTTATNLCQWRHKFVTTLTGSFTLKRSGPRGPPPANGNTPPNQFAAVVETESLEKFETQIFDPSKATAKGPFPVA